MLTQFSYTYHAIRWFCTLAMRNRPHFDTCIMQFNGFRLFRSEMGRTWLPQFWYMYHAIQWFCMFAIRSGAHFVSTVLTHASWNSIVLHACDQRRATPRQHSFDTCIMQFNSFRCLRSGMGRTLLTQCWYMYHAIQRFCTLAIRHGPQFANTV